MLKSTYKPSEPAAATADPLPDGWTEHKAPTGHIYYYNAETKQSTYTRPVVENDEPLQIDYNATQPDPVIKASFEALDEFHKKNDARGQGHFTGGRSYQDRSRRRDHGDRPKSKITIPNCVPWVLVKTKMGRRFVHNTETKQSLYKFPSEVMMAVIDMDRMEWEAKKKAEDQTRTAATSENGKTVPEETEGNTAPQHPEATYDSDSYEEVEVTDDEGEDGEAGESNKRPRLSPPQPSPPPGPVEFNEDDIEWQLAQMEGGEDDYGNEAYNENLDEEEEEGLPITEEDSLAIFRSLLDDFHVSPYSTFERVIEDINIVENPRYTSLPNTSKRREAFLDWSRDRVAEIQAQKELEAATNKPTDPKTLYLRFLHKHATPKLYWPEFKRKYRKEAELKGFNLSDKDREKLYRDYISKMKTSESDRKKELVILLKSETVKKELNRQSTLVNLPDVLTKDLRFYLLSEEKRDELVQAHIATL